MSEIYLPVGAPLVRHDTLNGTDSMIGWMRQITKAVPSGGAVASVSGAAPIASTGGANPVISLNDTAVTPATYGDSTHVGQFTVDQKGRLTFAQNVAIAAGGTVTHTTGALTLNQLVLGNGGADIKVSAATDGQVPIGTTSDGTVALATLTAGSGITITNGPGAITIATAGGLIADYVVMSNGANPPSPVDDGAGNFIYVGYTP
jgi:hypothetical protein